MNLHSTTLNRNNQVKNQAKLQWVMLQIGDFICLLPQQEVCAVESVNAMVVSNSTVPPALGKIRFAQQEWPCYCLSEQLQFLSLAPSARRACLILRHEQDYFGLLCDDARVLPQTADQVHALPTAMRSPHSPLLGLVQMQNQLACLSDSAQIARYARQYQWELAA